MRKLSILSKFKSPFDSSSSASSPSTPPTYHKVTASEVRDLNELIRLRYKLDNEIWAQRYCTRAARVGLTDKMNRSMAVLAKIQRQVAAWDHRECWNTQEDYIKLIGIRRRVELDGKRDWGLHKPWDEGKFGVVQQAEERVDTRELLPELA